MIPVTEREWLQCLSPWTLAKCFRECVTLRDYPQLEHLLLPIEHKFTPRKMRLFLCAIARRVLPLLSGAEWRTAVELVERSVDQNDVPVYSDFSLVCSKRPAMLCKASQVVGECFESLAFRLALESKPSDELWASCEVITENAAQAIALSRMLKPLETWKLKRVLAGDLPPRAEETLDDVFDMESWYRWAEQWRKHVDTDTLEDFSSMYQRHVCEEQAYHGYLLNELFGNPFRMTSFLRSWRTSDVVSVAQAIYDNDRYDQMPILADALEEAGCTNNWILDHCRLPNPRSFYEQTGYDMESPLVSKWAKQTVHVKGCWVVDLVLGKK